jgi:hypothetical protein
MRGQCGKVVRWQGGKVPKQYARWEDKRRPRRETPSCTDRRLPSSLRANMLTNVMKMK